MKKAVIITGAAGAIGSSTASVFVKAGYELVLIDIEPVDQRQFEAALICTGDLASPHFLESIVLQVMTRFGRVDVLVNNAAWRTIETLRTITYEDWNQCLNVSLTAPAFLAKYCAEKMQQESVIINISSIMAERAGGYAPAYVCAKAGLEALTRELSVTYSRKGIRAVCVSPGFVDTAMSRDYSSLDKVSAAVIDATPLQRPASPVEIAEVILWLSTPAASFINGAVINVDGGLRNNFNPYSIKKNLLPGEY